MIWQWYIDVNRCCKSYLELQTHSSLSDFMKYTQAIRSTDCISHDHVLVPSSVLMCWSHEFCFSYCSGHALNIVNILFPMMSFFFFLNQLWILKHDFIETNIPTEDWQWCHIVTASRVCFKNAFTLYEKRKIITSLVQWWICVIRFSFS